jgi:DNA-binding PadR family transcriptional regulator
MPQKKFSERMTFKELGSLQEKALFYLAENPDNHKQGIQQGIEHPSDQYGSVLKAVDALEKMGYIQSKKGKSQKQVKIKIYDCTEFGVFYALTRNPSANITKILDMYKSKVEFCQSFLQLYKVWGHDYFTMYLRDAGDFLPMVQKNGVDQALPFFLMKILKQMKSIDPETRNKNAREALKIFPETKKMLEELKRNINEIL